MALCVYCGQDAGEYDEHDECVERSASEGHVTVWPVACPFDPRDPVHRELLAEAGYMRERREEAAVDRERNMDPDSVYLALSWNDLSDFSKRPYRAAIAEVCDTLARNLV